MAVCEAYLLSSGVDIGDGVFDVVIVVSNSYVLNDITGVYDIMSGGWDLYLYAPPLVQHL